MNKNHRVEIANKTLEIVKNGFYEYKGKKIIIEKELKESIENTVTIAPKDWDVILKTPIENKFKTEIVTKNCSTIEVITEEKTGKTFAALWAEYAKDPAI